MVCPGIQDVPQGDFAMTMFGPSAGGGGCVGDFNGNGAVDFDDLNTFTSAFQNQDNLAADFNGNGSIDFDDLNTFIAAFQAGCP